MQEPQALGCLRAVGREPSWPAGPYPPWTPWVLTYRAYSDWDAAAGGFFPFENAVVGNIAPEQVAPITKPDRAFRPTAPGVQALHGGLLQPVLFKAWIKRGDGRIRVTWVRTPAGRGWKSGIHRHAKVLLRVVCFRCKRMVCTVMGCKVYVSQHTCRGIMGTPSPSRAVTAVRRGARDYCRLPLWLIEGVRPACESIS